MLTHSCAFATLGDAHGEHSVMVAIERFYSPWYSFQFILEWIPSHWIYVPCIWLALCWLWLESDSFRTIVLPIWVFTIVTALSIIL